MGQPTHVPERHIKEPTTGGSDRQSRNCKTRFAHPCAPAESQDGPEAAAGAQQQGQKEEDEHADGFAGRVRRRRAHH